MSKNAAIIACIVCFVLGFLVGAFVFPQGEKETTRGGAQSDWPGVTCSGESAAAILGEIQGLAANAPQPQQDDLMSAISACMQNSPPYQGNDSDHCNAIIGARQKAREGDWTACIDMLEGGH